MRSGRIRAQAQLERGLQAANGRLAESNQQSDILPFQLSGSLKAKAHRGNPFKPLRYSWG